MCKNNTLADKTCQQENLSKLKNSPEEIIKSLTPTARKVLNLLIKWSSYYKNLFPSQRTIGNKLDKCRQTINESLRMLEKYGLISSIYHHRTSKSYQVSSLFSNPFIRARLMSILPALKGFSIYLILSTLSIKPDTNINKENIYINSLYTDTTKKGVFGMSNIATMNTNVIFDTDASDNAYYATKNSHTITKRNYNNSEEKKQETSQKQEPKKVLDHYKIFKPIERSTENFLKAASIMNSGLETEAYQKYVRLVGKEIADKFYAKILLETTGTNV